MPILIHLKIATIALKKNVRLCSHQQLVVFLVFQTCAPNGKVAQCHLVDKLCKINTPKSMYPLYW